MSEATEQIREIDLSHVCDPEYEIPLEIVRTVWAALYVKELWDYPLVDEVARLRDGENYRTDRHATQLPSCLGSMDSCTRFARA